MTSAPEQAVAARWRRPCLVGFALFAAAFAIRAVYLWTAWDSPYVRYPMVDSLAYHEKALAILAGDWIGEGVFYQDPAYPYFLAALYAVFGVGSPFALLAQAGLDAASVVLVYALARHVFDERTALLAGALACSYKVMFYYDALLLKVPLSLFLVSLALFLLLRANPRSRLLAWLAAGLGFGLATLTRGNLLALAPFAVAWPFVAMPGSGRRRLTAAALVAAGIAMAIAPVTLRNYAVSGDFVLITSQAGQNFYIGNHRANATGEYKAPDFVEANPSHEEADFRSEGERRAGHPLAPSELSNFWFGESFREIRADPQHFAKHLLRKARVFANDYEVPDNQSYAFFERHVSALLRAPLPTFGSLLPLAACGAVFARRNRRACFLALFALAYAASVVVFFNMSRYRIPVLPALYVLAAGGAFGLLQRLRARELRTVIPALLFLAVATFVVFQEISPQNFARVHANMGAAHAMRAEAADRQARELAAVGDAAAVQAARDRAEELFGLCESEYRKALDLRPRDLPTRHALRGLLETRSLAALDAGAFERARERAHVLITTFPRFGEGYALLGAAEARLGESARAQAALGQALSLDPRNGRARAEREHLLRSATGAAQPRPPEEDAP